MDTSLAGFEAAPGSVDGGLAGFEPVAGSVDAPLAGFGGVHAPEHRGGRTATPTALR